jgi:hypothetical protein
LLLGFSSVSPGGDFYTLPMGEHALLLLGAQSAETLRRETNLAVVLTWIPFVIWIIKSGWR